VHRVSEGQAKKGCRLPIGKKCVVQKRRHQPDDSGGRGTMDLKGMQPQEEASTSRGKKRGKRRKWTSLEAARRRKLGPIYSQRRESEEPRAGQKRRNERRQNRLFDLPKDVVRRTNVP